MVGRKIIYVDDINYSLISLKERLKARYEVFTAQSSEILFEILEKITPELILLDINMPEVDGYSILRQLKADPRYSYIPVIFVTSNDDRQSLITGMELGAVDYLTKPFTDAKLLECIEMHLNPEKRDANKPIILAVDDNPSILKSINFLLNDIYAVRTLAAPEKLQELLNIMVPDLFLLDCNMPVLNGFDLVLMIRGLPEHAATPIIFITTEGTIDNISVAMHLGASDFIVKPIDETILREKTAAHLADYIMRRRLRDI